MQVVLDRVSYASCDKMLSRSIFREERDVLAHGFQKNISPSWRGVCVVVGGIRPRQQECMTGVPHIVGTHRKQKEVKPPLSRA